MSTLTLDDLQRMGEESMKKDSADYLETVLALNVHVNLLRKMRMGLVGKPEAQRKIAQASIKLAQACKDLQA